VGRKAGLTDQKSAAVRGDDFTVFNETERIVIELADTMVTALSNVSDDLYCRLRKIFSEEQLLQLGAQIAFGNYRARLNRVFDVQSHELYKPDGPESGGFIGRCAAAHRAAMTIGVNRRVISYGHY
jgi:hypothetical protein